MKCPECGKYIYPNMFATALEKDGVWHNTTSAIQCSNVGCMKNLALHSKDCAGVTKAELRAWAVIFMRNYDIDCDVNTRSIIDQMWEKAGE